MAQPPQSPETARSVSASSSSVPSVPFDGNTGQLIPISVAPVHQQPYQENNQLDDQAQHSGAASWTNRVAMHPAGAHYVARAGSQLIQQQVFWPAGQLPYIPAQYPPREKDIRRVPDELIDPQLLEEDRVRSRR
ncbi:hypothetical protein F4780DRAFT_776193 [Xylariomycetidae sp. FL0641]|nr:hypothetical protein F4780DRAFT_776193 [Xylariomycetidae sp. FL0641]